MLSILDTFHLPLPFFLHPSFGDIRYLGTPWFGYGQIVPGALSPDTRVMGLGMFTPHTNIDGSFCRCYTILDP